MTGGWTGSGGAGCDETGTCGGAGVGFGWGAGVGFGLGDGVGVGWRVTTGAPPPVSSGGPADPLGASEPGRLPTRIWPLARWLRSSLGAAASALSVFCWASKANPGADAACSPEGLPPPPESHPSRIASTPTRIAASHAIRTITRPFEGVNSHPWDIRRAQLQTRLRQSARFPRPSRRD
jgi:hypothetical protein